ncbi:MAG: hypothetical protein ACD_76C00119G0001 [uncultured bacterium]|nr:MAG: hypothetical protein ACD_76C00119G0001 [uncultured bacterium]HBD04845.1 hypothetical protein [Candidatus Uhrbacteria bacterium]
MTMFLAVLFLTVMALLLVFLLTTAVIAIVDVPYMPCGSRAGRRMMELAGVKSGEMVMDLGCGDAGLLILAAKEFGACGVGYEINPFIRLYAQLRVKLSGVAHLVSVRQGNIFKTQFPTCDVIVLFLLDTANKRLAESLKQQLGPGVRIVSRAFALPGFKEIARERYGNTNLYVYVS